jgi:hypothetical protein
MGEYYKIDLKNRMIEFEFQSLVSEGGARRGSEWQRNFRQFACWSMELVSLCEVLKQNLRSEEFYFYPRHQNVCATKTRTYW